MAKTKNETSVFLRRTNNVYSSQKRRAKKHNQKLDYDLELLRRAVNHALEHPCCYCGLPMDIRDFTVDHETPVSRGGSMGMENIRVIHRTCNEIKADMDATEFGRLLDVIAGFSEQARKNILARLRAGAKAIRR